VELLEDIADMRLNRLLAEHKIVGDILVTLALGNQPQHFELAFGEVVLGSGRLRIGKLLHQLARYLRVELGVTSMHSSDSPD